MSITISDTSPRIQYTASGSQTAFSVPFEFFNATDLVVIKTNSAGVDATLTYAASPSGATQYSVDGAGETGGGSITLGGGATLNDKYTIYRDLPIARSTDFPNSGTFPIETLNTELDKVVAMMQQNERDFGYSPRAAASTANSYGLTFPNLVADKILSVNSAGTALEFDQSITDVSTVAGLSTEIAALSAVDTEIGLLGTSAVITDLGILGTADVVTDLALLGTADVVSDMNTLATSDIVSDMNTLATSANVTAMGLLGNSTTVTNMGLLGTSAVITDMGLLGTSAVITDMDLLGTSDCVADMAILGTSDVVADLNTLATSAIVTDMDLLATSANVTAMGHLGTSANVTAMGLLGTSAVVTDMGLLGNADVIADMALLADADVISDMNTLATSDIVSDLNTLATSDIVSDLNTLATSDIVSDINVLATSDIVSDLNTLATSDIVSDINTLATSDIVTDLNLLATSDFVSDLNVLGTSSNVSNMNTLEGISSNITTAAGISSNITTVAGISGNVTTVAGVSANVTTVATNIAGVNSFADRYRVGSTNPSSSLDEGDLFFNTTDNALKYYNGSSWASITAGIGSMADDTTPQLGGDLDVNGNDIVSASNGDISITPNGSGDVILDGLKYPQADGSANQFLKTDGNAQLAFATVDLTALSASNLTSGTVAEARLPASALGAVWESKSANFTAAARKNYFCDTSGGAIDVTLPSGVIGDEIHFLDVSGTFDTNDLTILYGSSKIQGASANLDVGVERAGFTLVYYNSTQGWLLKDV